MHPQPRSKFIAEWWGDFVLIDWWNPPNVRHKFPDCKFTRYDLSAETRIESVNNVGDSTPDCYDCAFSGLDDYIEELSSMCNEDFARTCTPEITCLAMMESVQEEEEVVDELADDGLSYDLGWNASPSSHEDSLEGQDPAYDLGWGPTAPTAEPIDDSPAYNLGWGPTSSASPPSAVVQPDCGSSDGPVYDLGWGQTPAPIAEPDYADAGHQDDGPVYDLGWGTSEHDTHPGDIEHGQQDDGPVYDLGLGIPVAHSDGNEDNLAYDLGWHDGSLVDEPMNEDMVKLEGYQRGVIDLTSASPSSTAEYENSSAAEQSLFWANRRMKTIGHDMMDIHVHAIIENAVHGLNTECVPGQILMENRHLLGTYADARNRVTDISHDMCQLHRLIQLQHGLLRNVNHVIESLESDPQ
ncbi:hypothetical protein EV702DRAFT_1044506 [Suillus placidus]|uniref:Uncharacterized protein n=1 Tax=Suillus placidus TaxID=48579 RepID=A0A9P7D3Z4_9AGAM|nr:hypothetical protein EV702DRAFT_1044506 [Suillus placidus]